MLVSEEKSLPLLGRLDFAFSAKFLYSRILAETFPGTAAGRAVLIGKIRMFLGT